MAEYIMFVESPFQLLQAVEYLHKKNIEDYSLFIRLNQVEENNRQLRAVLSWAAIQSDSIFKLEFSYHSLLCLTRLFVHVVTGHNIVFGDENSVVFRALSYFLKREKVTLLDDGVATLMSNRDSIYLRFSIFFGKADIFNTFDYLRSQLIDENRREVNIIIGGKLVEEGICSKETYMHVLSRMVTDAKENGFPIVYIPHRGEHDANLEELKANFSIDIIRNTMPIEMIGLECGCTPVALFSVLSTALFSLSLIYKNTKLNLYPIPPDLLIKRKEYILRLFEIMRASPRFEVKEF